MAGIFFAIVGPSGVGKDAILTSARPRLEASGNYYFPKRIITRLSDAGSEDHSSVSNEEFVQAVREDQFSLWWMAHELHYGLPNAVVEKLNSNQNVIANISRRSVSDAIEKFERVVTVEITAKAETISKRLLARGRETEVEIMMRQSRKIEPEWSAGAHVVTIENDHLLDDAIDRFISTILKHSNRNDLQAQMV